MVDFAGEWLARLYGAEVKKAVRRATPRAGTADPWALGAVSAAVPGGQSARGILLEPVRDDGLVRRRSGARDAVGHRRRRLGIRRARRRRGAAARLGALNRAAAATAGGSARAANYGSRRSRKLLKRLILLSRIAILRHEARSFYTGERPAMGQAHAQIRRRIDGRLTEFATSGKGDVKRLKGRQGSRLRVGDWRVIFYEERRLIIVVAVGHRREIYD